VTGNFVSARPLYLLDENAQCNPIWVSRPEGLTLVHFKTFQQELTGKEHPPFDASYEKCERHCLQGGHL
jgi:hypothetical protein